MTDSNTAVTFLPDGNVCTPKGFRASGIHCGLRRNKTKKDLALIVSDVPAAAAAVYTLNAVKGAPIAVTKANIADGRAQAMLCNSGNANTCAPNGEAIARKMCMLLAEASGLSADDVIIASTGVIGQPLPIEPIATGMKPLVDALTYEGGEDCAAAIMTTDLVAKHCAVTVDIGGKTVTVGGIAKGSGMIHPNMATMLVFITTDAAISSEMLQKAVSTHLQHDQRRRRHVDERHAERHGQRPCGQRRNHRGRRRLRRVCRRAPHGHFSPEPRHCQRRRRRDQTPHLHGDGRD